MKSCVEVPEYFYNLVSYSDDELHSCFSTVWSSCFVFFSVFARANEEGMLGFIGTTFVGEFFRQKFQMTALTSGFKKAYVIGFTSELVAVVKDEIVSKTPGIRSGRFKTLRRWLSIRSATKRVKMLWKLCKRLSPPGHPMRYVDAPFSVLSRIQSLSS